MSDNRKLQDYADLRLKYVIYDVRLQICKIYKSVRTTKLK